LKAYQKHIVLGFIAVFASVSAFSQIQPRSTQHMFNTYAYNPAYVAGETFGDVCVVMREQMMGFKDYEGNSVGPSSQLISFQMPLASIRSGVLANYKHMTVGVEAWDKIALGYAYQFDVGDGVLGAGLTGSFISNTFDFEKLNPKQSEDKIFVQIQESDGYSAFDMGAGVIYKIKKLYFGVSAEDLLQSQYSSSKGSFSGYVTRHFYIVAGYEYQTSNQNIVLKPSFMYKNAGRAVNQADFNLLAEVKKKFFAGLAYTTGNDLSGIFGVNIKDGSALDGVRAGVSFDLITSDLSKYGSGFGSLEVMVGYAFRVGAQKQVKSYKSVRFL